MTTLSAKLLEGVILEYNIDLINHIEDLIIVNNQVTGEPYLKPSYNIQPCANVITFFEYYFHRDEYNILSPIEHYLSRIK